MRDSLLQLPISNMKEGMVRKNGTSITWKSVCNNEERLWIEAILGKYDLGVRQDFEKLLELFTRKCQENQKTDMKEVSLSEKIIRGKEEEEKTSQTEKTQELGHLIGHVNQLNFLVPRKKMDLALYKEGFRLIAHGASEIEVIYLNKVKRLLKLPLAPVEAKIQQWGFVWMIEESPGIIDTIVMSIMEDRFVEMRREDNSEVISIPVDRLEEFLRSYFQRDLISIDESIFSLSTSLKTVRPYGIPCYRKNKEGNLFFLQGGDIYFGWKKPFEYIERKSIDHVEFLTITSRTFDVRVVNRSSGGISSEISSEISMIAYRDFDLFSRYLQTYQIRHNLDELSAGSISNNNSNLFIGDFHDDPEDPDDEDYSPPESD